MQSRKYWVVLAVALSACGGSSSPASPAVTTGSKFTGTLSDGALLTATVGATQALRAALTSSESAAATASSVFALTGTITTKTGQVIPITGTYDDSTKAFSVSGGGYSVSGTYANGSITATGTAPSGSTISCVAFLGDDSTVTRFCGTYHDSTDGSGGTFMLVIQGSSVYGEADDGTTFVGTVSGNSFDIHAIKDSSTTAHGTLSGTSIAGSAGTSITFSGTACHQ
jgi:hypothetical protein